MHALGAVALLAVAYVVTAKLGTELVSVSVVSAVWPAAGVALAGLLVLGPRAWPAIAIGGFALRVRRQFPKRRSKRTKAASWRHWAAALGLERSRVRHRELGFASPRRRPAQAGVGR